MKKRGTGKGIPKGYWSRKRQRDRRRRREAYLNSPKRIRESDYEATVACAMREDEFDRTYTLRIIVYAVLLACAVAALRAIVEYRTT